MTKPGSSPSPEKTTVPTYDGSLVTLDVVLTLLGVSIAVKGTVEILAIRRRLDEG